jgi:hypothetical protein
MRLFRHRGLDGCRCYVHTKVHWLSILVLFSDTAVLCRYCSFSHIPIVGHHMSILVAALAFIRAAYLHWQFGSASEHPVHFSEFDLQFLLFHLDVRLLSELGIKCHSEVLCCIGRWYPDAIEKNWSLINLLVGEIDICSFSFIEFDVPFTCQGGDVISCSLQFCCWFIECVSPRHRCRPQV